MTETSRALPDWAMDGINLALDRLGARVIEASDAFFADESRMLQAEPPVFIADKYDDHGKWMDGWETRRRRGGGHDHAVIRLACAGVIRGVDIDTSHFTGNYPPAASIEYCHLPKGDPDSTTRWQVLVPAAPLGPDAHHFLAVPEPKLATHLRLNIYPDGGVARLRVYGDPWRDWSATSGEEQVDLAASLNGGRAIAWNDAHYGHPSYILSPGRGVNMGDGWETRRRREPGHDWIIIALGHPGMLSGVVVETTHYKGNYPDACSIQAGMVADSGASGLRDAIVTQSQFWPEILSPQKLAADSIHEFGAGKLNAPEPVSHVRLNIHPDGGISRFRCYGTIVKP